MPAHLYPRWRPFTGEVFPASSSTGEAASRRPPLVNQRGAPATHQGTKRPGAAAALRSSEGSEIRSLVRRCVAKVVPLSQRLRREAGRPSFSAVSRSVGRASFSTSLRPRRWFVSRGELVCPFVGEPPGVVVVVNRLRQGVRVAVERFPRRVDDEGMLGAVGGDADRHDALQWAARLDCHERAGRAGHPWFERAFGHRGIEADQEVGAHKATPPRRKRSFSKRPGAWSEPRESGAGTPQPTAEPQRPTRETLSIAIGSGPFAITGNITSQFEEARRRAPKVGARAPQTLSGSARWNDERPVLDPAVRTSLGGGEDRHSVNATDSRRRGYWSPRAGKYLTACARHACVWRRLW